MGWTDARNRKLKVNLGLVQARLKLIEKKKTDLNLRARPEIAEYVQNTKVDRARIRVESIIREDFLVEAMELVEMYADLIQSRLGLLQSGKLDESLKKPIATLIWVTPQLSQYCEELKKVQSVFIDMFGKQFVKACQVNEMGYVCERVMQKLDPKPPKANLIENYLLEICRAADVQFNPDPNVLAEGLLPEPQPSKDFLNFNEESLSSPDQKCSVNQENNDIDNTKTLLEDTTAFKKDQLKVSSTNNVNNQPTSSASQFLTPNRHQELSFPELPSVPPNFSPSNAGSISNVPEDNSDIDFDDLTRRFNNLRKK